MCPTSHFIGVVKLIISLTICDAIGSTQELNFVMRRGKRSGES